MVRLRLVLAALLLALSIAPRPVAAAEERPRYVRVHGTKSADLPRLEAAGDVDGVDRDGSVRLYTSAAGLARLKALGYAVEELPDPGINPAPGTPRGDGTVPDAWDAYPTWPGYVAMMEGFETACGTTYADICHLVDLGPTTNTVRPHRLYAIKISDNPLVDEEEPEVLYTSTMHGDETVGAMNLLHLIDELLRNYDPASPDPVKQEITALVDGLEIWINPFANPDGTYYSSDSSVSGATRYVTNPNGSNAWVDPNRNFPDPVDGSHPDGEVWWLETQTMMAFASARHFVLSANFHGGAEVVNYPWDTWCPPHLHPDDAWFQAISRTYATNAQAAGPIGYMTDLNNGITNGCDWYRITGGRQDYMTYWQGGREVTIEVSSTKNPAGSTLPGFWTANRQALLDYLKVALRGVRGVVRDNCKRPAASATIEVIGHDFDNSQVRTGLEVGDYHRLLLAGTYDLRFSGAGLQPLDVLGVVVTTGAATRLDVSLVDPAVCFCDDFESGATGSWSAFAR